MSDAKKMGVVQLTMLTAINMMGSGVILLPAKLAEIGTISILSWLVTALGSLALAYCFAQCGMLSRKSGGMFGYAEYPLGMSGRFMSNYTYCISILVSNVAIAITAVGYAAEFFGVALTPLNIVLATVFILWVTTVANFGGSRFTGQIGGFTIWGVIIPVVGICIIGWFWFKPDTYLSAWNPHDLPVFKAISSSIAITLWAFLGLESACANSDAVDNPTRNVPIAVLGGTLSAAIIYIISTNVIAGIVPNMDLATSTAPFGLAFSQMFNPTVGKIIMALMCFACVGSLLGWQFTFAQVVKSGSESGFYPKIFTKITKAGTPIKGMLILVLAQTALSFMTISPTLSKQFDVLLNLAVLTNVIPYVLSMAALVIMQKIHGVNKRRARRVNIIMLIATGYTYYAIYNTGAEALTWGGIATFMGWTLYGLISPRYETARNKLDDTI
ncbi:putrescine-ornithine antiporter [Serratia fonticola]|uniref:Putrescine transporter PotE n=1 Tax=Serratia fonticola TaxID=47917 RepID=A0AAJ2DEV2_SERFO|nr:putrescine-ornithine antiporter [Serratia fonticola]MDQ9129880.1 putrescine-ornithine antiporter [Serratia fonticola]